MGQYNEHRDEAEEDVWKKDEGSLEIISQEELT